MPKGPAATGRRSREAKKRLPKGTFPTRCTRLARFPFPTSTRGTQPELRLLAHAQAKMREKNGEKK
jgi:hypothetical protein